MQETRYGVDTQSVIQSFLKTPVCGASLSQQQQQQKKKTKAKNMFYSSKRIFWWMERAIFEC